MVNGSIGNVVAERVFLTLVGGFALLLMLRHRVFPGIKAGRGPAGIHVGGPGICFGATSGRVATSMLLRG